MDNCVINICFHGIGEPGRELEPGEAEYWVDADRFNELLDEIAGWPSVAISFDDGNESDHRYGLPGLIDRRLAASYFVLAGRLDTPGSLSTDQVRDLARHGMTIGSHGMDHRPWVGLDDDLLQAELVEARELIAAAVVDQVDLAACPLGRYDRRVLRQLRRLEYRQVFTSDRVAARRQAWLQPRYSVHRGDTPATLREAILNRQSLRHRVVPWSAGAVKRLR